MTNEEMEIQIHDFSEMMYKVGFEDGQKSRKENDQDYKDGLEDGRMEAWECARKLIIVESEGGLPIGEQLEIFDNTFPVEVLKRYTASEAIAKIKEYEESKKQVNQWDEIYYNSNPKHKAVIINIGKEDEWNCLDKDNEMVSIDIDNQKYWNKTGKNYSKCTNILEQLRGENNDN